MFESVGYDGGHRKSLIPPVTFEVRKSIQQYFLNIKGFNYLVD